ncbi:Gfo/Idh/MocA family oxidoreductase [Aeoliella sp. ICT_H6.2]|uniref:Gfo/Idh/MocA family oxidoreductase n=1 Tax=Aeoliella straminimaris TaxID=2954799 RepID=A0A9X2FFY6_9BACT|nr:Gfo/Idh/MocA family oxidoreductase [Aeoliella straminimaris]MCO6047317.1 Gfo/Idh/MocA family oxidoreductase [Aeoliella straminimaris]
MKLRLGVIGLGNHWASRHMPALRALSDRFEVRAVCDPVSHRAQQLAMQLKARSVDSFREVAFAEDVDAVLLLSARWFGSLPIVAACEAGKAVYCGASLELNAQEAATLREQVREAGIAFMAEFPCRLAPATLRLQELMATKLGPPRMLFCNHRHTADRGNGAHGLNGTLSDVNMSQTVEMVDWCRYLVGTEPQSVMGLTHPSGNGESAQDYLLMVLDFEKPHNARSRPQAQIACGSYVHNAWSEATAFRRPADLQVVCERGIAFVDLPSSLVWFDSAGQHMESLDSERPVGEQLLLHFHRQVASLLLKTASLEDAYRAMSIVIAAQQSHGEGRRIACG